MTKRAKRRTARIIGLVILALALLGSILVVRTVLAQPVSPTMAPKITQAPLVVSLSTTDIITDINAERASAGLEALSESPVLDSTAQRKSNELQQSGWNSQNVEANHLNMQGQLTANYVFEVDPACRQAAENLSYENNTSQAVVTAWEHSAAHLAAMNGPYQQAGVGISGVIVTLHLCEL